MSTLMSAILAAIVATVIVSAAAALAWHGTLTGGDFLGVVGTVVALPSLGLGASSIAKTAVTATSAGAAAANTKPSA